MTAAYRPEPLLRPPVEFAVALTHASIALLLIVNPPLLLLPTLYAHALAAACAVLALWRILLGLRLQRYQRKLGGARHFTIPKIVADPARLYLGRGFPWQQRHVQRLKEARTEPARRYLKSVAGVTGDPLLHGVGLLEREKPVYTSLAERNGHTLVLGATRSGKTRLAELLIGQDIARRDTVIVLDPKGDNDLLRRIHHEAKRAGRLQDLHVIHLRYPQLSRAYNPIASYHTPDEIASRIAGLLPSRGEGEAFRQFAWRFLNTIAVAMHQLGYTPTYARVAGYIENIEPLLVDYYERLLESLRVPQWRSEVRGHEETIDPEKNKKLRHCKRYTIALIQYSAKLRIENVVAADLLSNLSYDRVYYDKITASLRPLLEKLKSDRLAPILAPQPGENKSLSWPKAFADNSIVYVGLDALANPDVAHAVGNSMFADLASAVGRLYASQGETGAARRICIHADEFARIVGPHLHPMLSMAGGAGIQITAYTQTLADIEAAFEGSRSHAARITGNFNSVVMLRVRTEDTARILASQAPIVDVVELVQSESVADSSQAETDVAFTSSSSHRTASRTVQALEPGDLMRLPKGEAFALLETGLQKIRIPLIDDQPERQPIESILGELS